MLRLSPPALCHASEIPDESNFDCQILGSGAPGWGPCILLGQFREYANHTALARDPENIGLRGASTHLSIQSHLYIPSIATHPDCVLKFAKCGSNNAVADELSKEDTACVIVRVVATLEDNGVASYVRAL